MIDVLPAPGMVKDFEEEKEMILRVAPHVSWIHIDVADQTLVPNETFRDFSLWQGFPDHLSFEAHLMVANPEKYIKPLVKAGFKRLIAHLECQDPRRFLEEAQYEEVEVGLALDGPSAIEEIEPFLEEIDVALLMGIEAGFSGQQFQLETVEKVKAILHAFPQTLIEVDGGVNDSTGKLLVDAGVRRLISTSYIFSQKSEDGLVQAIKKLQDLG